MEPKACILPMSYGPFQFYASDMEDGLYCDSRHNVMLIPYRIGKSSFLTIIKRQQACSGR